MVLDKEKVHQLIPQKAPFVMVDNLTELNEEGFSSDFEVKKENIFFEDNKLQEPALIENIAQTVAAGFGQIDSESGGEPKLGFIGAISKLKITKLPEGECTINTTVKHIHQFQNVFLVKGESFLNNEKLIECEMKIVVQ